MESAAQSPARKKKARRRIGRVITLAFLLFAMLVGTVLISQEAKLRAIKEEQELLLEEITYQQEEMTRMEYMIDYSQNEAYLIQYAREKLGYIRPDELKFDIGD